MDDNNGWICLHRTLLEHDLWTQDPFSRGQAWVDLLLLANHKEATVRKRGIKITISRGQVGWSERQLAERWRWSRGKVGRFLEELETVQQIRQQNGPQNINVTSLITIINYEKFQETDRRTGRKRAANSTMNNNDNNDNKENTLSDFFETLWKRYPNSDGKKAARKNFDVTVTTDNDRERISKAQDNYLAMLKHSVSTGFDRQAQGGGRWFSNWQDWENWTAPGTAPPQQQSERPVFNL